MSDSLHRCAWCGTDPLYVAYHDEEWGVPEYDARALWEKLLLDGFQAGLAWITILRKREGMRDAFDGFDPEIVAAYGEADIERLLGDARPVATPESEAMSKALKKRGFTFVGPVIVYAFMQAVGMVNDHGAECFRHRQVRAIPRS